MSTAGAGEVRNVNKPSPITVDPLVLKKKLGKMRDLSNGHSLENGCGDLDSPRTPRTVATPGKNFFLNFHALSKVKLAWTKNMQIKSKAFL